MKKIRHSNSSIHDLAKFPFCSSHYLKRSKLELKSNSSEICQLNASYFVILLHLKLTKLKLKVFIPTCSAKKKDKNTDKCATNG